MMPRGIVFQDLKISTAPEEFQGLTQGSQSPSPPPTPPSLWEGCPCVEDVHYPFKPFESKQKIQEAIGLFDNIPHLADGGSEDRLNSYSIVFS